MNLLDERIDQYQSMGVCLDLMSRGFAAETWTFVSPHGGCTPSRRSAEFLEKLTFELGVAGAR
jgi:hypothetical protein